MTVSVIRSIGKQERNVAIVVAATTDADNGCQCRPGTRKLYGTESRSGTPWPHRHHALLVGKNLRTNKNTA